MSLRNKKALATAIEEYGNHVGTAGAFFKTKNVLMETFKMDEADALEVTQQALEYWTDIYCD